MPHSKQRYLFIDLLRFIAVVFMVQGHTFDALLDFDVRSTTFFFVHDFFHGFIAPMFLFASGVAFGISTLKKWEEHAALTPRVWKRIGKFLGLLVIGYALHLPFFSLQKIVHEATPAEIASWLQVDALHCIAATLLLLQITVLIVRTEQRFVLVAGIAAGVIIFFSPIVWSLPLTEYMPLWLASYFYAGNNSWFPIFPWSGFILCGVLFSWLFINAKEHHHAVRLMQNVVALGIAMFIGTLIVVNLPFHWYPHHDVWKVNPLIILARLSFVAVVTSSIFFAEHSIRIPTAIPQIMGRESLFIYVLHLIILYGSVLNQGLQQIILPTLSVMQASLIFLVIISGIMLFSYGWYQYKMRYKRAAMATRIAIAAVFIIFFITRPY